MIPIIKNRIRDSINIIIGIYLELTLIKNKTKY